MAAVIDGLLDRGTRADGDLHGVVLLSAPDLPATAILDHPIRIDAVAASGRTWAWTLGQRYVSLDRLRAGCRRTSDL